MALSRVTPGCVGIGKRIAYSGELIPVWADSPDGSRSIKQIIYTDSAGKAYAAYQVAEDDCNGYLQAGAAGTYNVKMGTVDLGQITIYAPAQYPTTYPVASVADIVATLPKLKDDDIIQLAPGKYTFTSSLGGIGKRVRFYAPAGAEFFINTAKYVQVCEIAALVTFENIKFTSNQLGRFPIVRSGAANYFNCTFDKCGIEMGGGPTGQSYFDSCKFINGAGGFFGNNSAVVRCDFSGWPRVTHPCWVAGNEVLVFSSKWHQTERAILIGGNNICVSHNYLDHIAGQTNQGEQVMAEDSNINGLILSFNKWIGGFGPAFQVFGGTRAVQISGIYARKNWVSGSNAVIILLNAVAGGGFTDNIFSEWVIERCNSIGNLTTVDGPAAVVNTLLQYSTFVDQCPTENHQLGVASSDCNPKTISVKDLAWNPATGTIHSNSAGFIPAHLHCQLQITGGTGWSVGQNEIMNVASATDIQVRNWMGTTPLAGGVGTIAGAAVVGPLLPLKTCKIIRPFTQNPLAGVNATDTTLVL